MKHVFLTTLGCKVNQFETASFTTGFAGRGLRVVDTPEQADIIVINTCAVTGKASAQSRRDIRRLARGNARALLVVTGCHAQLAADEIRRLAEIEAERLLIIGNNRKNELVSLALAPERPQIDPRLADMEPGAEISRLAVEQFAGRSRAFLRVQDGCNHFCSYCIVPFTRGRSRSLPADEVLAQVGAYESSGHREIVVTGVHVGQYGADRADGQDITALMELLCRRFPRLRFRLSSIEPTEITAKLLTLMRERDNFMPHLHIPLQSGDDVILARMNRRYSREQFAEKLAICREMVPDAAIGIDVLVGFPGEQPIHFDNTVALLEQIDCTYLHAFPYSLRPGTRAASFPDPTDSAEKQRRVELIRAFGEQRKQSFYRRFLGTRRSAVVETERDPNGRLRGYTDNYIAIRLAGDDSLKNTVVDVQLTTLSPAGTVTAQVGGER